MNTQQQQFQQQLQQERAATSQAKYDAICNAISAEQSSAELAQQNYAQALAQGDMVAAADAQRRLARSEARLVSLESGKDAWDAAELQADGRVTGQQQQTQPTTPEAIISSMTSITPEERAWLMKNAYLVTTQQGRDWLSAVYKETEGRIPRNSREYFEHFDNRLAASTIDWDKPGPGGLTPRQVAKMTTGDDAKGLSEYAKQYAVMKQRDANGWLQRG